MRFNITLPKEIGVKLKASKNHSQFIAESLQTTFERLEQERLAVTLREGYRDRSRADAKLNREFDQLVSEGIED